MFAGMAGSVAQACPEVRPVQADGSPYDLVVAIREKAEPFTYFGTDGDMRGFALELWGRVAADLTLPGGRAPSVHMVRCDTIGVQEKALVAGRIDVVISPLTITAKRMESYDFSQQYISSGLALAVPTRAGINFDTAKAILRDTVFSGTVAAAILGFLSFNLIVALMIRWILFSPEERHAGGRVGEWIRAGLEAVMRTVGLRGIGDGYKGPVAKLFEIFLAVVGTALSATVLGILTSAFVGSMGDQNRVPATNLPAMRIATLNCSTGQEMLQAEYRDFVDRMAQSDARRPPLMSRADALDCTPTPDTEPLPMFDPIEGFSGGITVTASWAAAMELLATGQVEAVLGDWVALTYLSRRNHGGALEVLPNFYRNEPYGWGITRAETAQGVRYVSEDLRGQIDKALIREMRGKSWREDLEKQLGQGSVSPN